MKNQLNDKTTENSRPIKRNNQLSRQEEIEQLLEDLNRTKRQKNPQLYDNDEVALD